MNSHEIEKNTEKTIATSFSIYELPIEVLGIAFTFFSLKERSPLVFTSKHFNDAINAPLVVREQIKNYFNISEEELRQEIQKNDSLIKTFFALREKHQTFLFVNHISLFSLSSIEILNLYCATEETYTDNDHHLNHLNSIFSKLRSNLNLFDFQFCTFNGAESILSGITNPNAFFIELSLPLFEALSLNAKKDFLTLLKHIEKSYAIDFETHKFKKPVSIEYQNGKFVEKDDPSITPRLK